MQDREVYKNGINWYILSLFGICIELVSLWIVIFTVTMQKHNIAKHTYSEVNRKSNPEVRQEKSLEVLIL
jgi:hypothetical protein